MFKGEGFIPSIDALSHLLSKRLFLQKRSTGPWKDLTALISQLLYLLRKVAETISCSINKLT